MKQPYLKGRLLVHPILVRNESAKRPKHMKSFNLVEFFFSVLGRVKLELEKEGVDNFSLRFFSSGRGKIKSINE